jgi:hypothetical protein
LSSRAQRHMSGTNGRTLMRPIRGRAKDGAAQRNRKKGHPRLCARKPRGFPRSKLASVGPSKGHSLSLARTHALLRFALRALACKPGARRPWRARSAGQSLRFALPAALGHRPEPSLARAFAGTSVHRTLVFIRLAHWTFALIRFTPLVPLRAWASAAPLPRLE